MNNLSIIISALYYYLKQVFLPFLVRPTRNIFVRNIKIRIIYRIY